MPKANRKSCRRCLNLPIFFFSFHLLLFVSVLSDDSSSTKKLKHAVTRDAASSNTGLKVLIICLGLVAVVAFSVFLFRTWQRKKKEDQHARLLKLFEDDDELEVELGIRD